MSERADLLASITKTIQDYRAGEIAAPTPEHVDRWVKQFDKGVQTPMLREMDHVLKQTYFKRDTVAGFLGSLVKNNKLAGEDACEFWRKANFLDIQKNGHSQEEMLEFFGEVLLKRCKLDMEKCGSKDAAFVYLDDVLFTGGRTGSDLCEWLTEVVAKKLTIHIVVIATHTFAEYKMPQRVKQQAKALGKEAELMIWRIAAFENKLINRNTSEVLWPTELPDDEELKAYLAREQKFPFRPRVAGGKLEHNIFSSEEGRQLLERELLLAGVRIRRKCENPKNIMRPLGFSPFGLGFGSMIATFRNCPNNTPLALWWGDPKATSGHLHWYPLLPRKTYEQSCDFDAVEI